MSQLRIMNTHTVSRLLTLTMAILMGVSLIVVTKAAYGAPECPKKYISGVYGTGTKTYYTFTDGTAVWSQNGFNVGEAVCIR
jgi:hypothetical protein